MAEASLDTEKERKLIREGVLCTRCLEKVLPSLQEKGSAAIEIVLWLFLLIPGVIYSIWRRTDERRICPACGSSELVPFQSERAKSILGASKWEELRLLQKK